MHQQLSTYAIGVMLSLATAKSLLGADQWPQAAGPNGNFVIEGAAPVSFSVASRKNIIWRAPLPSTGQGSAVIAGDRVFVTSHEPIERDTETGTSIFGLCFDANSGKELWRREIPGTRTTDLSSLFSDNTAASPIAKDNTVCFVNVGGSVVAFDFQGAEKWRFVWTPFGRHHSRQHEPILDRGRMILMHAPRTDLPAEATTKAGAKPLGRGKDVWTYLQSFDIATGKRTWQAECGTSCHSTSLIGTTSDGRRAILTGRGGGHQPPEEPYGLSLVNAADGSTIWDLPIPRYPAAQSAAWNSKIACAFVGKEHWTIDANKGRTLAKVSLVEDVTVRRYVDGEYVTQKHQKLKRIRKAITNQCNLLVGDYHYFRAHDDFLIGRVHLPTNRVEYLHVPVQATKTSEGAMELRWRDAVRNDMKNSQGFLATQDRRNAGNGWGHVSAASPIVVGEHIYIPTMLGVVYVLKWNAETLDERALASISDLGPAGETWSLSSLSYADGRLYARTLKELICIGEE